jgi:hypothetical protein
MLEAQRYGRLLLRAGLIVRWLEHPDAKPIDLIEMPEPPR